MIIEFCEGYNLATVLDRALDEIFIAASGRSSVDVVRFQLVDRVLGHVRGRARHHVLLERRLLTSARLSRREEKEEESAAGDLMKHRAECRAKSTWKAMSIYGTSDV